MTGGVFQKNGSVKNYSPGSRFNKSQGEASKTDDNLLSAIIRGIVYGLGTAVILLLIISLAAVFYDIPETVMNYIIIVISIVSLFFAGFVAAGRNEKNGLIVGIISGLIYALIVYFVGCIIYKSVNLTPEFIADLAVGAAVGGLGGVVGINRVSGKKRKRK